MSLSRCLKHEIAARDNRIGFTTPTGRDEDYLCLVSDLAESLRAIDNGPAIFNT